MQPSVERIQRRLVVITLIAAALWALAFGAGWSGVLVGGAVILASVWLFARIFTAAIVTGRRTLATGLTFVKLAVFLALGWLAFSAPAWAPDPMAFAVGVSGLPLAALWEALEVRRN